MNEQPVVTPPTKVVMRGWSQICPFVGCKSPRTARKHLDALGLLVYTFGRPVLSVDAYRLALLRSQYPQAGEIAEAK
jgi:hypothetical protein